MKKLLMYALLIAVAFATFGCSRTTIEPGRVGVKVDLNGGDQGTPVVLGAGRYWITWNEEIYIFPTFQQSYVWTADAREGSPNDESVTFQTSDGLSIGADLGITYSIKPENVAKVFVKYRRGVEELTDVVLRNMVRDAFVKRATGYTAEEAYSNKKSELMDSVTADVVRQANENGITVDKVNYIGSMRLPPQVIQALNDKIKAVQVSQQVENELRTSKAQAEKEVALAEGHARAMEAEARGNRALAASITPALVEMRKIDKWNGQLPQVTGGGANLINIK